VIIRDRPHPLELLFVLRGSVVPQIWRQIAFVAALSAAVTILQSRGLLHVQAIAALPFSLIGIALSIFSGFRNSASYERWWEARKMLGQLVIESRNLSRLALVYVPDEYGLRVARATVAFAHALRCHLRNESADAIVGEFLSPDRRDALLAHRHVPNAILHEVSTAISAAASRDLLSQQMVQLLEGHVSALSGVLAGTERIKQTPLPYAYSLLLHRTAYAFCFLLPFGLIGSTGIWTPLLAAIVAYTFFGLDALGDELATPFDTSANGLPLAAITRSIEINVLEQLGVAPLPDSIQPREFILL
jgi:putative membrane protein